MLGLTSETKPQIDPVAMTANTLNINLAPVMKTGLDKIDTSKGFDAKAEAGAIGAARNDTAEKLALAGDIRMALAEQMPDGDASPTTSLGNPATSPSMMAGLMKAGGSLGLGLMVGGPVGAALGAVGAVMSAAEFVAAPPQHAGLPGASGPSAFTSAVSKDDNKNQGPYVDAMGTAWDNGFQVKPVAGTGPKSADVEFQRKLQDAAKQTIEQQGARQVKEALSQATVTEQRLINQDVAARRQAENVFGVDAPALEINKPKMGGPRMPGFFG